MNEQIMVVLNIKNNKKVYLFDTVLFSTAKWSITAKYILQHMMAQQQQQQYHVNPDRQRIKKPK